MPTKLSPNRNKIPKNRESTRYFSSLQEERVASLVGGNRTSNSGAGNFSKGDVVAHGVLIECKTPTKPKESVSIKKEWIEKNAKEAFEMRIPNHALAICFEPGGENHFLIGEGLFSFLCNKLREEDC